MGLRILIPRPAWRSSLGGTRRFVWAAFGIAVWGTAYSVFGASGMVGVYRAWAEVARLEAEVAASQGENRSLEAEIDALKSDPATIEQLAREEFFLGRPDERVYLLPPLPPAEEPVPGPESGGPDVAIPPLPGGPW